MGRTASLQLMVTNQMRSELKALGYLPWEIECIKPEMARAVIDKELERPFGSSPMPESWKQGKPGPSSGGANPLESLFVFAFKTTWKLATLPVTLPLRLAKKPAGRAVTAVAAGAGVAYVCHTNIKAEADARAKAKAAEERKKKALAEAQSKPKPFWENLFGKK